MKASDNIKSNHFIFNSLLLKKLLPYDLSLNEFLLIIYYINTDNSSFIPDDISKTMCINDKSILTAFNKLIEKKLFTFETSTDSNGKIIESVSLKNLYDLIDGDSCNESNSSSLNNLVDYFGDSINLTDADIELVKAWLDSGFEEKTVKDAFDEAKYNGVCNLRFIDKILYEWKSKGIDSIQEKDAFIEKQVKTGSNENLFDYNWLDE